MPRIPSIRVRQGRFCKKFRLNLAWILIAGALVFASSITSVAAETWIIDGEKLERVQVREVTPAEITIFHSKGIKKLNLADLPQELQERFSYNPEKAKSHLEEEQRQRMQALAQRQEKLREQKEIQARKKATRTSGTPSRQVIATPPGEVVFHREVDLRPFYMEKGLYLKDQGMRPSCSAFAIVSALEYEQATQSGEAERLSEEFLIWSTLKLQPGIPLDTGFNFPEVITALQTYGVPPQNLMPNTFGKKMSEIEPSREAIEAAKARSKVIPVWLRRDDPYLIERMVDVINQRKPVIIALAWPHWKTFDNNNVLSRQKPMENASHAVTLVGYRNTNGTPEGTTFIFRNSYGYEWGLAGCGFVTSHYLKENLYGAFFLRMPIQ